MANNEREFIEINKKMMNTLREILDIKTNKCYYCGRNIDFDNDKYSIYNKPDRLICNSPLCIAQAMEDDE